MKKVLKTNKKTCRKTNQSLINTFLSEYFFGFVD